MQKPAISQSAACCDMAKLVIACATVLSSPPLMKTLHHLIAILLSLIAPAAFAADAKRPNVVVLLADDQGWGDLSFNGNTNISTPNIDSLGKKGAVLERFFVCPVCSPTRAEFLTGRWHPRSGVWSTSSGASK